MIDNTHKKEEKDKLLLNGNKISLALILLYTFWLGWVAKADFSSLSEKYSGVYLAIKSAEMVIIYLLCFGVVSVAIYLLGVLFTSFYIDKYHPHLRDR